MVFEIAMLCGRVRPFQLLKYLVNVDETSDGRYAIERYSNNTLFS
jgi:hypothetical protein